jgi:hypothetical protein
MTTFDRLNRPDVPAILTPEQQRAVWFLGALIWVRAGGSATGGFDGFTLTAGSPAAGSRLPG